MGTLSGYTRSNFFAGGIAARYHTSSAVVSSVAAQSTCIQGGFVRQICCFIGLIGLFCFPLTAEGADVAPPPTAAEVAKTGELDLTFTRRSPLSTRKEIARRLTLPEAELGDDYDLAT